jgi:metallo-beta-lactamase class B
MRSLRSILTLVLLSVGALCTATAVAENPADWTTPLPPFQIADHLYYVGSRDLAAYLITTPAGNILLNANLTSSPPQIRASVEKLGFRWADIKLLLNSQAHFDHSGGAAEIRRETHAQLLVMQGDAAVMESGGATDFLAATGSVARFPPVHVDRVLHNGEAVALGGVTLIAHRTGGHTRGCTTWTLRVHLPDDPAGVLRNVVIVGGMSFWSDFRFVPKPGKPASYPGIEADFAQTFRTLHALPCDIFLGAHGSYFNMLAKLARMPREGDRVWIDRAGYRAAVDAAQKKFDDEVARERAGS